MSTMLELSDSHPQPPAYERIRPGSIVELFPEPSHPDSGPHEDDQHMPVPRCRVVWVKRNRMNPTMIESALLIDQDTGEEIPLARYSHSYVAGRGPDRHVVERRGLGAIHRVLHR